jgi:hypothetical protein
LFSPQGIDFVAHTLPFTEIALGVGSAGWLRPAALGVAGTLLLGFLTVVTRAYALRMDINCGCFATPEPINIKRIF